MEETDLTSFPMFEMELQKFSTWQDWKIWCRENWGADDGICDEVNEAFYKEMAESVDATRPDEVGCLNMYATSVDGVSCREV